MFFNRPGNIPLATLPEWITSRDSYQAAIEFMKTVRPKDGVDYDWVSEYAKKLWDYRINMWTILDGKADSIIKYLGGGIGLLTLGVLAGINEGNAYLVAWTIPAIAAALGSIIFATRVKLPVTLSAPPPIRQAVREYAETEKKAQTASANFLGQLDVVCEGIYLDCRRKADLLVQATRCYATAIVLLLLPVMAAVWANRGGIRFF